MASAIAQVAIGGVGHDLSVTTEAQNVEANATANRRGLKDWICIFARC